MVGGRAVTRFLKQQDFRSSRAPCVGVGREHEAIPPQFESYQQVTLGKSFITTLRPRVLYIDCVPREGWEEGVEQGLANGNTRGEMVTY